MIPSKLQEPTFKIFTVCAMRRFKNCNPKLDHAKLLYLSMYVFFLLSLVLGYIRKLALIRCFGTALVVKYNSSQYMQHTLKSDAICDNRGHSNISILNLQLCTACKVWSDAVIRPESFSPFW